MLESIQILVLSLTIVFFIWWIRVLKKDVEATRKKVRELRQRAKDKAERDAAERLSAEMAKVEMKKSKLWTVGES